MNKQSIVEAVHEKLGGTKVAAEQAVETMIETIMAGLKKDGDEVSIAGLGIFSVKTRAARTARNPQQKLWVNKFKETLTITKHLRRMKLTVIGKTAKAEFENYHLTYTSQI
jgi:DNA-binding protein HU-beta